VQIVSERLQFYAATQMTAYNNFFEDVKEQRETMGNGGAKIIFNNRVNYIWTMESGLLSQDFISYGIIQLR